MLLPSNEILENWTRIFGVENDTSVHQTFHKIKNKNNATSMVPPNGFIANIYAPVEGKRLYAGHVQSVPTLMQYSVRQNGDPLCIYGDPAYPLRMQLQAPFF